MPVRARSRAGERFVRVTVQVAGATGQRCAQDALVDLDPHRTSFSPMWANGWPLAVRRDSSSVAGFGGTCSASRVWLGRAFGLDHYNGNNAGVADALGLEVQLF